MTNNRPIKKLWEIYNITSSKRVFQSEWKDTWVPFYRAREIVKLAQNWYVDNELYISEEMYNEYAKKYWIPKENDIMVTWVGTIWICYFVKKNDKFYFKDWNILWFKSKDELVYSRFVEYLFSSNLIKNQINKTAGSVVATLTIEKAKEIQIPLPPLDIQKAIVAKLDEDFAEINEAINTTQANIGKTNEFTAALLKKIFEEKKIDFVTLNDVCVLITDGTHATPKYIDKWIPFLSVKNITKWIIDLSDTRFISEDEHKQLTKRCCPEYWDILYSKVWTTWVAKIIDIKVEFSIFVSLALLKVKKDIVSSEYLEKILNSPLAYQQAQARTRGVANRNLVITDIKTIEIPLPPLPKQQEIVKYLNEVFAETSELKSQYQNKLIELKELKASILQSAFEGKLI